MTAEVENIKNTLKNGYEKNINSDHYSSKKKPMNLDHRIYLTLKKGSLQTKEIDFLK